MKSKISFEQIYDWILAFFCLLMIIFPKQIPFGFIAVFLVVVFGVIKKKLKYRLTIIHSLFISLYLLYALYTVFSRHPELSNMYLENKLTFLLIPLLLAFQLKSAYRIRIALWGFVLSVLILVLISLINAFVCYFETQNLGCLFSSLFSTLHHPSYLSAYVTLAIAVLIYLKYERLENIRWFLFYPSLCILILAVILCSSLAGLLFFVLALGVILLWKIRQKFGKLVFIFACVLLPGALYMAVNTIPILESEWSGATQYVNGYLKNPEDFVKTRSQSMSGSEARIVMWTVSYKLMKIYPLGVGTGNVDEVLGDELRQLDMAEFAKKEYNPHNQFFQTSIEIGFLGLSILFAIIGFGIFYSIRYKNYLLGILACNLAFNMLFESMLQRQSGIVFYTLLFCVFTSIAIQSKPIKNKSTT